MKKTNMNFRITNRQHRTRASRRSRIRTAAALPVALLLALGLTACPGGKTEAPEVRIHEGELLAPRGKNFTYVDGDVTRREDSGHRLSEGRRAGSEDP